MNTLVYLLIAMTQVITFAALIAWICVFTKSPHDTDAKDQWFFRATVSSLVAIVLWFPTSLALSDLV